LVFSFEQEEKSAAAVTSSSAEQPAAKIPAPPPANARPAPAGHRWHGPVFTTSWAQIVDWPKPLQSEPTKRFSFDFSDWSERLRDANWKKLGPALGVAAAGIRIA